MCLRYCVWIVLSKPKNLEVIHAEISWGFLIDMVGVYDQRKKHPYLNDYQILHYLLKLRVLRYLMEYIFCKANFVFNKKAQIHYSIDGIYVSVSEDRFKFVE